MTHRPIVPGGALNSTHSLMPLSPYRWIYVPRSLWRMANATQTILYGNLCNNSSEHHRPSTISNFKLLGDGGTCAWSCPGPYSALQWVTKIRSSHHQSDALPLCATEQRVHL